ncbi:MAG: histidinol-phosphate transaminase [Candidatus Omnitrophota bacterium]
MRDLKSVAKKTVFTIKPYVPGKPIDEVKREFGLKEVIKLASNENPYSPSPKVVKAINNAVLQINRYPDGYCFSLRETLSRHLNVKPTQLVFGNGSDELIVMAARLFVNEGDEVINAKPSFLIYDIASKISGAKIISIPLKNFHYDLDGMKKAITDKTRIIFLGNPDNPAGTYLKQKDVERFLEGIPEDILIFIDEAYYEYVDAKDYVDSIKLLKTHKNLIVTRTFSKMYGLAGLRIGYGVANPELCDIFDRIREPFNINSIAQAAAVACLKDKIYYRNVAKKINTQRKFLYDRFTRMKIDFQPSSTNFILVNVKRDSSDVSKKLMENGIIVRDMSSWGMGQYIRVTVGTKEENRRFIEALEKVL